MQIQIAFTVAVKASAQTALISSSAIALSYLLMNFQVTLFGPSHIVPDLASTISRPAVHFVITWRSLQSLR